MIPFTAGCLLCFLPYINHDSSHSGIWFVSKKGKKTGIISFIAGLIITPAFIITDEILFDFTSLLPDAAVWVSSGLVPVVMICGGLTGYYYFMKKKFDLIRSETVQTVFILMVTIFIVLTVTAIWFRGENMKLVWPV